MTKQPWWGRFLNWCVYPFGYEWVPKSAPKPAPKPSAQGIARANGWTRESAGYYTHPTLGTVEEMHGKWQITYPEGDISYDWPTMTAAMERAAAHAQVNAILADDLAALRAACEPPAADAAAAQDGERGAA